jgi:ribosomal protein S13
MTLKKKVVVEGLGRVTQPLRTTVPRGYGQTPVQVEKATPWQETGIGKLSQALGLGIQIAGQVKQIGDIKEEEAIQDLANKPAEEIDKALSNNRGQFDKTQRNGLIPFLGNPWNQERVQKASGALLGDTFEVKLQEALTNAPYDSDVDSIVNDVIAEMSEEHSRLSTPAAHDGFREAIKGTIQQYKLRYNANKNAQKKDIVYKSGVSVLFKAAQTVTKRNEQGEEEEVGDYAKITNWWKENEGAFLPQEKLKMIKEVGVALAEEDSDEARKWAQWAGGHLKIGTALMGDPTQTDDDVFNAYSSETADLYRMIDQIEARNEGKAKGDANLLLTEIESEVAQAQYAFDNGSPSFTTDSGEVFNNIEEVRSWAVQKGQESNNPYASGSQLFKTINQAVAAASSFTTETQGADLFHNERSMTGGLNVLLKQAAERVLTRPSYLTTDLNDKAMVNPAYTRLADSLKRNYNNISFEKAIEVSTGSYIDANGEFKDNVSRDQRFKDLTAWNQKLSEDYEAELNELLKEEAVEAKARAKVTKKPSGSYIDENVPLDEGTSKWREPHNFYDIEKAIREGSFEKAKKIAEELTNLKAGRLGQITFRRNLVKERLSKLRGAETSLIEKDKIRRELLLYAIAIEGGNLYNAEAIKRGSINIADTEIKIEDKEALQDLALVYPLISKKRLQELATQKDPPAADIFELYNALFDTNLQEGVEADDLQVAEFINQTKKLYE